MIKVLWPLNLGVPWGPQCKYVTDYIHIDCVVQMVNSNKNKWKRGKVGNHSVPLLQYSVLLHWESHYNVCVKFELNDNIIHEKWFSVKIRFAKLKILTFKYIYNI
jgi:extradiol dioxygenase family protein